MTHYLKKIAFLIIGTVIFFGLSLSNPAQAQEQIELSIFGPALPQDLFLEEPASPELIDLGRMLYYEKRLSKNQDISCNSCHQLKNYGVDNKAVSPGHKGQLGNRNSPSVYHAAGHIAQFWDGRAADVEEQALGPILNPAEMAMPSEAKVLEVLNSIPEYVTAFKQAFPEESEPVTYPHVGKAIGAFERELITPAPFDSYYLGNQSALSKAETRGLKLFTNAGCIACHNGTYIGGQIYQQLGLVEPWPNQKDLGRYEITGDELDKMVFKVPSLRNVAETAPYFHDGSVQTLKKAVALMGKYQLGLELTRKEIKDIVAFLGSLTGEIPSEYIQKPQLPVSTLLTPLPDNS